MTLKPHNPNAKAHATAAAFRAERAATVPTRRSVREAAATGADDFRHGVSSRHNGHYSHTLLIFAYREGYYAGGAWTEGLTAPPRGSEIIRRWRAYLEAGGAEAEAAAIEELKAKLKSEAAKANWRPVQARKYGQPRFEGETDRDFADRLVRDYRRRKAARLTERTLT